MKIKMTTCAVTTGLVKYENGSIYETGKSIDEKLAKQFVKSNFAVVIEENEVAKTFKKKVKKDASEV